MWRWPVVIALAACSSAPPPAPSDPHFAQLVAWDRVYRRSARETTSGRLVVDPPHFVVGDVLGAPRLPSLAPQLPAVAAAWPSICEERGELADDVLEYTLAWCAYARGEDVHIALTLERLAGSPTLRTAVLSDLRALEATEPVACEDLDAVLADFVPSSARKLRAIAAETTRCGDAARALLADIAQPDEPAEHLIAAYARWDAGYARAYDHAVQALPVPGAEQVAIAALSAALSSGCADLGDVRDRARRLLARPEHDARWTPTLQAMAQLTPGACDSHQRHGR